MKKVIFIILGGMVCVNLCSQVTIGSTSSPVTGALLDLKEKEDSETIQGKANSTKGLLLPRVQLTNTDKLFPMISDPDYANVPSVQERENKLHTGLMVYNTKIEDSKLLCPGVFMWNSERWNRLGEKCYVLILAPGDRLIDFGTSTANKSFSISTNIPSWQIKSLPAGAEKVLSSTLPTSNTIQQGSTDSDILANHTITLTPVQPPQSYTGHGAAGSVYQTTMTIEAQMANNQTKKSENIVLKRTVPPQWDGLSISPDGDANSTADVAEIALAGAPITATVNTNREWHMAAGTSAEANPVSQTATGYGSKTQTININKNETWSTKKIHLTVWATGDAAKQNRWYKQKGYTLRNSGFALPTTIPQAGSGVNGYTITMATDTSTPDFKLEARDYSNFTAPAQYTVIATNTGNVGARKLVIPAYAKWANRDVRFYFEKPNLGWEQISTNRSQYGYNLSIATSTGLPAYISQEAKEYTIMFNSSSVCPDNFAVEAWVVNDAGTLTTRVAANTAALASLQRKITIPVNNTWTFYNLQFRYYHPGDKVWKLIDTKKSYSGYTLYLGGEIPSSSLDYEGSYITGTAETYKMSFHTNSTFPVSKFELELGGTVYQTISNIHPSVTSQLRTDFNVNIPEYRPDEQSHSSRIWKFYYYQEGHPDPAQRKVLWTQRNQLPRDFKYASGGPRLMYLSKAVNSRDEAVQYCAARGWSLPTKADWQTFYSLSNNGMVHTIRINGEGHRADGSGRNYPVHYEWLADYEGVDGSGTALWATVRTTRLPTESIWRIAFDKKIASTQGNTSYYYPTSYRVRCKIP